MKKLKVIILVLTIGALFTGCANKVNDEKDSKVAIKNKESSANKEENTSEKIVDNEKKESQKKIITDEEIIEMEKTLIKSVILDDKFYENNDYENTIEINSINNLVTYNKFTGDYENYEYTKSLILDVWASMDSYKGENSYERVVNKNGKAYLILIEVSL